MLTRKPLNYSDWSGVFLLHPINFNVKPYKVVKEMNMGKKIQVTLPDYFSVKHYKSMGTFEHLDEAEKIIATIVATTEHSNEEVMRWNLTDLIEVYKGVSGMLNDTKAEFYPVFDFNGVRYGFQPLSKMSVAEWIDLSNRIKDPVKNLEEILAICYRPIVEDKFEGMEWKVKSYIKTLIGQSESLFKYYKVEEYDTEKRDWRAKIFQDLPIEYATGCLTFFLGFSMQLQRDIIAYSPMEEEVRTMMLEEMDIALKDLLSQSTLDGFSYYETWKQESYLTSPVSQT